MNETSTIFVAGHHGLVGSALIRRLMQLGYGNVITRPRTHLDLTSQSDVSQFFDRVRPEYVFLAAARVGGILANSTRPAEFIAQNLQIQVNVIDAAYRAGCRKLLFLGSSCIYPKFAPQPIQEQALLTGVLEPTNEWYAVAKIAGIKMCQAYRKQYGFDAISVMPTNVYGPGDNFSLTDSHVLPALIRRFVEARERGDGSVVVWGTGEPKREFLHVDDLADACVFLMRKYSSGEPINVGTGEDISIKLLATMISETVGFEGEIIFDASKPDGTPRKLLDVSRLGALGWRYRIDLQSGLLETYRWFEAHRQEART